MLGVHLVFVMDLYILFICLEFFFGRELRCCQVSIPSEKGEFPELPQVASGSGTVSNAPTMVHLRFGSNGKDRKGYQV